ncbi:MAG: preprotein translocase subunit YajC [Bacteroides sp.]|nr:preprotein translocase subunit YajC [Bacteroides sp.]
MNQLNTLLLQAQAGQGNSWTGMLMIVAMIAIFYFFMIRPQSKKQKEIKKQREAMKNGDRIVTAGGIHGKIKEVKEAVIIMEVAPGVAIKVDKNSVYPVIEESAKK